MAIRPYKSRRGEWPFARTKVVGAFWPFARTKVVGAFWPYSLADYASQGRPYKIRRGFLAIRPYKRNITIAVLYQLWNCRGNRFGKRELTPKRAGATTALRNCPLQKYYD